MKIVILLIFFFITEYTKGQSEINNSEHLIQDISPKYEKDYEIINSVTEFINKNVINIETFFMAQKENPLIIKKYSDETNSRNDFIIVKGNLYSISVTGEDNSACEICFKDYFYSFKMYLPIQEDFYNLRKGKTIYAFVNINNISKYEITCNIALAATTPQLLAQKYITLFKAIKENDLEKTKELLDVGLISIFNCDDCNYTNSLNYFINHYQKIY